MQRKGYVNTYINSDKIQEEKTQMKQNDILLSIIIPIYNAHTYLSATLENVLAQSFEEYELILVDDGSTDGSEVLCDSVCKKGFEDTSNSPEKCRRFRGTKCRGECSKRRIYRICG